MTSQSAGTPPEPSDVAQSARAQLLGFLLGAVDRKLLERIHAFYTRLDTEPESRWILRRLERELARRDRETTAET
jgi:hypothetical protein